MNAVLFLPSENYAGRKCMHVGNILELYLLRFDFFFMESTLEGISDSYKNCTTMIGDQLLHFSRDFLR